MRILAVDDEALAREMLEDAILEVLPDEEVISFSRASQAEKYAAENPCDIAFLDIQLRGTTGLELAEKIKKVTPRINIIFVTGYDEYKGDAMDLRASGYIMKPVTAEKVREELKDLRYPIGAQEPKKLRTRCFGNFEIFDRNGKPIHFSRSKSKELLAYLVYRNGASSTIREIAAALFEDSEFDRKCQVYMQQIVSAMNKSLKNVGAEDIVLHSYNSLAVDTEKLDCDYYEFDRRNREVIYSYSGEFMAQYYWAEDMAGYLEYVRRKILSKDQL